MSGPADAALRAAGRLARAAALVLVLLLPGWTMVQGQEPAPAQTAADAPDPSPSVEIDLLVATARTALADPATPTDALESLREQLMRARNATRAAALDHNRAISDVRTRLDALGPAPAEGESEAPEVARLRAELAGDLAAAEAPLIVADEAAERADALIGEIDRVVRGRISAELLGHGPSPLLPSTWTQALSDVGGKLGQRVEALRRQYADPATRAAHLRRLPTDLLLLVAGLAVTFVLRQRIGTWIARRLAVTSDPRSVAWIVALRNLNRLVVPTVGAALLLAALDGGGLAARLSLGGLLGLPAWVMVLIGAGWLSGSFFAPQHGQFRVAPLSTPDAEVGGRLALACGAALAAIFLLRDLAAAWELSPESQAVLRFPLVVLAAFLIWQAARSVDLHASAFAAEPPAAGDAGAGGVGPLILRLLAQGLRGVALLAPAVAALGYGAGGGFLVVAALLTLGLLGAAAVIYDVLYKTVASLMSRGRGDGELGLMPVAVGALVILGCLPLLALVWGARPADIREAWDLLAQGVTLGGITISFDVVVKFLLAFVIIVLLTRLFQSVLVGTVLPRTRLDVGAREAARAGVGYVGFVLAILAGIGAAGLDLSSLAIVAGALSVGIGFGLQTIVSNFVSGIILLVERPIKPGDWIEVGGYAGYVRGIRVRSTEIETFDRASVIIPNSQLIAGTVLNRTHTGMSGRLQVMVSVTYGADPRAVERILLDIASRHPLLLEQPAPTVLLTNLGPDSMDFELRGWLRDVNYSLSVRSDLNYEILTEFDRHGIRMQFYGRDLRPTAQGPAAGDDA